jgi:hypothetical protein
MFGTRNSIITIALNGLDKIEKKITTVHIKRDGNPQTSTNHDELLNNYFVFLINGQVPDDRNENRQKRSGRRILHL